MIWNIDMRFSWVYWNDSNVKSETGWSWQWYQILYEDSRANKFRYFIVLLVSHNNICLVLVACTHTHTVFVVVVVLCWFSQPVLLSSIWNWCKITSAINMQMYWILYTSQCVLFLFFFFCFNFLCSMEGHTFLLHSLVMYDSIRMMLYSLEWIFPIQFDFLYYAVATQNALCSLL